jgi:hypothetical protein
MANSKISALTSATTPLAGTETLPVVQSSATTKVTVANLTAGRAVSASSLTVSSGDLNFSSTGQRITGDFSNATVANRLEFQSNSVNGNTAVGAIPNGTGTTAVFDIFNNSNTTNSGRGRFIISTVSVDIQSTITGTGTYLPILFLTNGTEKLRIATSGDTTFSVGNLIQGTAAKGVDFSANTPLAGKTSTVLNWYEEGTWTPNQGAGLTLVGAFSSTGKYTRIGRQVSISGTVTGATSVAVTAAGVITTSLPFTIGTAGHGDATNAAITASAAVICNTGTTLTSAGAIAATGTITFSATYFV